MIPLMRNTFCNEQETKRRLIEFISNTNIFSMGVECAAFEHEFAQFQGASDAVLFNSGGSANLAMFQSLKNLGRLKAGDKVGFSGLTWSTNIMPLIQLGFEPVPIDCEPKTLNVMSWNLKKRLEETDLQAFFITNALGFAGDLDAIKQICNERGVLLLEDNCEALGTELGSSKTGSFGEMASFSFFVAHHMSTIEGGMICTSDTELAEMLRIVRANGWDRNLSASQKRGWREKYNIKSEFEAKYTFYDLGFNFRPTEITGFLGRYQLSLLKDNILARQRNYLALEPFIKANDDLTAFDRSHIRLLSCFAMPVICKSAEIKDIYVSQFSGAGVEIRPMIAGNIQNQPFYRKYVPRTYGLPGTQKVHDCGFYCGNYPELTRQDIETLASCLSKY